MFESLELKKPALSGIIAGIATTFIVTRPGGTAPNFPIDSPVPIVGSALKGTRYLGTIVGVATFISTIFADTVMEKLFPFIAKEERIMESPIAEIMATVTGVGITLLVLNPSVATGSTSRGYFMKSLGIAAAAELGSSYVLSNFGDTLDIIPFL